MSASSVTGTGPGASDKVTTKELATAYNGPTILIAGIAEGTGSLTPTSPPADISSVTFPNPLPGSADKYCVILTTVNGGLAYIAELFEDDDENFSGFSFLTEAECDTMYIVVKRGVKA